MSETTNGGNPNGSKEIEIASTPPKLEQIKELVNSPGEIKLMMRQLS